MVKKVVFFLTLLFGAAYMALASCGGGFLCCGGRAGYYVSNAVCVNGVPYTCTYVPCPSTNTNQGPGSPKTPQQGF